MMRRTMAGDPGRRRASRWPSQRSPRCFSRRCGRSAAGRLPQVRVNQVGYPAIGPKVAYVMLARPVSR